FSLAVSTASIFLTGVTPDHSGTNAVTTLTLSGLGFYQTTSVSLLASNGASYAAAAVQVNLPTQVTATFAAGSVPAGVYSVVVTKADGSSATLDNAFTMVQGGRANLVTNLVVPNPIGRHIASTIYVQYSNAGDIAMPAPLLVLSATQNGQEGA